MPLLPITTWALVNTLVVLMTTPLPTGVALSSAVKMAVIHEAPGG
jgi:hypothetical protein